MSRYKPYSRRELLRQFRAWRHVYWKQLAAITGGCLVLLVLETYLLLGIHGATPFRAWLLGVIQVGVVALAAHRVILQFLASEAKAITQLRGAWGEDNTRDELRRAKRKKLIWGWVDAVAVRGGDIDHLVVTRHGGLVAIDSKWRNRVDVSDRDDMARRAHKARLRADGVLESVVKRERGGHRAAGRPINVRPIVVMWGSHQDSLPEGAEVDGVEFVAGRRLGRWLRSLEGEPVDGDAAGEIVKAVERFREIAWNHQGI